MLPEKYFIPIPPAKTQQLRNGLVVKPVPDHFRGDSSDDRIRRHILRHNRTGQNHCAIMDRHASDDFNISAYPNIIFNDHMLFPGRIRICALRKNTFVGKRNAALSDLGKKGRMRRDEFFQRMPPDDRLHLPCDRTETADIAFDITMIAKISIAADTAADMRKTTNAVVSFESREPRTANAQA